MKEAVEDSFMLRNYGTEDGNEALQKKSQVVYNKKNGVEKPWLIRYNFHI